MKWTKVLPENDGYYWFRNKLHSAQIVSFFKKGRIVSFGNHFEFVSSCCKVDAKAEWAGPIPEPEDSND